MEINHSLVYIRLDPGIISYPIFFLKIPNAIFKFKSNKEIIDVAYDLVCVYKPNIVHFQENSAEV